MYALTHNESHAVMARAFDKTRFYEPLKSNHDALGGLHANTHLAQASDCRQNMQVTTYTTADLNSTDP